MLTLSAGGNWIRTSRTRVRATNPSAMPAASVKNFRSRHSDNSGSGIGVGRFRKAAGLLGGPPSGANPISFGVGENKPSASTHIVATITRPTTAAALANPKVAIAATQRGEKITPPMLPPLYAMPSAAERERMNRAETMLLTATALMAPQPTPVSALTTKSCQGTVQVAQPTTPAARHSAATLVASGGPVPEH